MTFQADRAVELTMRHSRSAWTAFAAILAGVVGACSPHIEPVLRGAYVLRSIAGVQLPAIEAQNAACGELVVADTLLLYEDGTGVRRSARDVSSYTGAVDPVTCEPAASSPRVRRHMRIDFTYRLTGDAIEVELPCRDFGLCIAPPHLLGTVRTDGVVFDESRIGRYPLVYDALPP